MKFQQKISLKFCCILLSIVASFAILYPSLNFYFFSSDAVQMRLGKGVLRLGLDLVGGTYLLLDVDMDHLKDKIEKKEITVTDVLNQVIETIRNRIDKLGVLEPFIAKSGTDKVMIQMPGIEDPEAAKQLIGQTALLEFRLVNKFSNITSVYDKLSELKIPISSISFHSVPDEVQSLLPEGSVLIKDKIGSLMVVEDNATLTGEYIVNASVQFSGAEGFGKPEVSLRFNSEGASIFSSITGNNIGKNLAIILDGKVQSAPVIRSRISDGVASIQGNFSMEDAKLLATVLRAGSLPAPVSIIEERTIGPKLGLKSIRASVYSTCIGLLLIFLFILFYYKESGIVVCCALTLNLIFLFVAIVLFNATLTLTGFAGVILSLAMAVDANVLILERIKEELGRSDNIRLAIKRGYEKAFSTILDANLTTFIAAFFLFQFGTGSIKGFGVTLSTGILLSMFTSVFATRIYYDWKLQKSSAIIRL